MVLFLLQLMTGLEAVAAYAGGFIPARVGGLAMPGPAPFPLVPVLLTPLTATLVHAGWLHLGFNMLMLIFCGRQVEAVLGSGPVLVLYGVGAYAAAAAQWLAGPQVTVPMVGASGAISALMGTYSLLYSQRDVPALGPIPARIVRVLWLAAGWIGLQLLVGLVSMGDGFGMGEIAIWAHVGGFLAGLLLTRPLLMARFGRRR